MDTVLFDTSSLSDQRLDIPGECDFCYFGVSIVGLISCFGQAAEFMLYFSPVGPPLFGCNVAARVSNMTVIKQYV